MSNITSRSFSVALILALSTFGTASAVQLDAVVGGVSGSESNGYAVGTFENSNGDTMATWSLNASVSSTDFSNDGIQGGSQGLQYVMLNEVLGSDDTNVVTFTARPTTNADIGISIGQSPYFDNQGTWNGGNFETAQFAIYWSGGGLASVTDPDNQISGVTDGGTIGSGSNLVFSSDRIFNDSDSWGIDLPEGVETVTLHWSSVDPVSNSDLTREWVSFDVSTSVVPEPTTGALFSMALLSLGLLRRRRR